MNTINIISILNIWINNTCFLEKNMTEYEKFLKWLNYWKFWNCKIHFIFFFLGIEIWWIVFYFLKIFDYNKIFNIEKSISISIPFLLSEINWMGIHIFIFEITQVNNKQIIFVKAKSFLFDWFFKKIKNENFENQK